MKEEDSSRIDIDFGINSGTLKTKYLDLYEDVYADMVYTNRFDENSDLSTTYLGQTKMTRDTKIKAEKSVPITGQGFTSGKLLDGTGCQILLDSGATKSYMSKSFYLKCKCLNVLPQFTSHTHRIQVGNRQYVGVLFVIPVIIDIHGHKFEIYTPVSEIHENVDLVLGIKNIFELEVVIDLCDSCFSFLNRSIPFFPKEKIEIPPKTQKMVIVEAPFQEKLLGMAIIKVLDMTKHITSMMKLKFIRNKATLKITNNTNDMVTFDRKDMIGILDLRSLDYYKVKQDVLQKHHGEHYHFELAEDVSTQFNRFVSLLKKEEESPKEKYPWLDDKDERKYVMDREILEKYINLDNSCLTKAEKKEENKYKDAFSLRDEIGSHPNIEVEIDVMDKCPFFIRPFLAKEEDKTILFKKMKRLCYLGILKEGFSTYSSPVVLISRKLTKDKRVVMDFRHLNIHIVKNSLPYPLLKDTFLC